MGNPMAAGPTGKFGWSGGSPAAAGPTAQPGWPGKQNGRLANRQARPADRPTDQNGNKPSGLAHNN